MDWDLCPLVCPGAEIVLDKSNQWCKSVDEQSDANESIKNIVVVCTIVHSQDLFCLSRDQEQQQSHSPSGGAYPIRLHKRTSSSCVFTETPLLQVPPRTQMHSRARLPDTWLDDRRRRKLCSWELERLQRLLEHSATTMFADSTSAPNVDGDGGGGGVDSSTSPTATTTTTASPPPPHTDLEERLSAQMTQRFNKMEM
ncbi:hypothetical protein TSMEX_009193 [Taenia solium]|eukprot:TsM_001195100 transcript=TsM_001195100 gene=TsM_001195100